MRIDAAKFEWRKRQWDAPPGTEQAVDIGYKSLHLYDGGVYDNLGLEPFFDAGKGKPKQPGMCIIISDAGSPLPEGFSFRRLNPGRLIRIADIMSNQAHALRVRTFANYLQQGSGRGALIFINTPVGNAPADDSAALASRFPTTLRRLTFDQFDRLANHGYHVTEEVERLYGLFGGPVGMSSSQN